MLNAVRVLLLIVVAWPLFCLSATTVYVWTDENGITHYSDTPHPGAKALKINDTQSFALPSVSPIKPKTSSETPTTYQLTIEQPASEDTVRNNNGIVLVSGSVSPTMAVGLKVQLVLDNQPTLSPQLVPRFRLDNVDRGAHQLKLQLLDETGKVIASSPENTFFMHRPNLLTPKS